jgi:hypothetical protein
MERQKERNWWKAVTGKVKGFGWVDNFIEEAVDAIEEVVAHIARIIALGESSSYEAYNTGTKDVPGGRVGHS